jgi:hypothetical protein
MSVTAWSCIEPNYTFATMVRLVMVLHHGFDSSKRTFITLLSSAVKQSKGALICPQTSFKGATTLHMYPIWIYETTKGGLQPQP